MNRNVTTALAAVVLMASGPLAGHAQDSQAPKVSIPNAGVPQIMTLQGRYVRAAYNNEGYGILGYRIANMSVGEEWLLLDFGVTLRDRVPDYKLTRDSVSLDTPDGNVPMASLQDYRAANLTALNNRAAVVRDSINYFPPSASRACRIGFFSDLGGPVLPWDNVELTSTRACVGRLYFKVPGGIKYGQHFLNIKFAKSTVRVPFRILTKEEDKTLEEHYDSIEKQVKEAFAPKKN